MRLASLTTLTILLLTSLAMAGCSGSSDCSDSQMAQDEGSLAFNGACTGKQTSTFQCDGSAEVSVAVNLAKGEVEVTVEDGGDNAVYNAERGSGSSADEKAVTGQAGTWSVTAERRGDLSGQYAIDVDCDG